MSKLYLIKIVMNDGLTLTIPPQTDSEIVIKEMVNILTHKTRYFKYKGIDYGAQGIFITFENEHGGVKQAKMCVYEKIDTIIEE